MTNPVHVLTVAALLLVAFLVGAVIGTVARLVAMRLGRKPVVVADAPVDAAPFGAPLVAAPVIAPLPVAPPKVVPPLAEVPVPDFAATLIALANEAPPAAFLEPSKPNVDLATTRPLPAVAVALPPAGQPTAASSAMQPAHVAGETTSGVHVDAPKHDAAPVPAQPSIAAVEQRTAEVIQFPTVAVEPTMHPTDIVVGGESVAVVDTSDLPAAGDQTVADVATGEGLVAKAEAPPELRADVVPEGDLSYVAVAAPAAQKVEAVPSPQPESRSETIPIPAITANAAVGAVLAAALSRPEVLEAPVRAPVAPAKPAAPVEEAAAPAVADAAEPLPVSVVAENVHEPIVEQQEPVALSAPEAAVVEPATEPVVALAELVAVAPEPQSASISESEPVVVSLDAASSDAAALDEDAAMRAIEGNWSPRRTPPRRPVRPAAEPEGANQAVAASARAVTAARRTAEAVVAEVAEVQAEVKAEAGRPTGLDAPRDGRKDDLTHIIGVLPVIETALNKLGLYHFDQMGELTNEQIAWIETHLGVPGRISRELWREQARELAAVLRPKRVAEK